MNKNYLNVITAIAFVMLTAGCKNNIPVSICMTNQHYFFYKDKPIVLITSDHHYGAVIDMDFDYVRFLEYLSSSGMNLTRIYPGGMFEPADKYIKGNPLGPLPGRQILPWARSGQAGADPMLAEPGKISYKYDLSKWNQEYFARLKDFAETADKLDIIVEVAFFNGMYADCWPLMAMYHENNIQNAGTYEAENCGLFTTADSRNADVMEFQKAYIAKITTELNRYDNIIYDICDEPTLQGLPGGSNTVMPDSIVKPWILEMKDAFLHAEASLPKKHLLGQTIQNLSPDLSDEIWCQWLPTEYVKPALKALNLNYNINKPLVNVETNYFGASLTNNQYNADAVRVEGWWYMLGGGAGCINLNGEFYHGNESGGVLTQTLIIPQKKILLDFMNKLDLIGISRFENFTFSPSAAFCNGLAVPGQQYAFYLFHGSYDSAWGANFLPEPGNYQDTLTISKVPEGKYMVEWIDPVTGKVIITETANSSNGNLFLTTPSYPIDIALKIIIKE